MKKPVKDLKYWRKETKAWKLAAETWKKGYFDLIFRIDKLPPIIKKEIRKR